MSRLLASQSEQEVLAANKQHSGRYCRDRHADIAQFVDCEQRKVWTRFHHAHAIKANVVAELVAGVPLDRVMSLAELEDPIDFNGKARDQKALCYLTGRIDSSLSILTLGQGQNCDS